MSCGMSTTPSTRRGGRSSFAKAARPGACCGASAGCSCRWAHLERDERRLVTELLGLNRRLAKAYLLKEQLAHLWDYTEGAARRFLTTWLRALRWQRLPAFRKVAQLLLRHLDGILAYCHEKVPFGKVEAINGNIRAVLRRGRGYRDHEYLLLKVQKATAERRQSLRAA
jgi:transposase